MWNIFSDCNWVKVANLDMADFVHIWASFFDHYSAIFWPIGLKLFMVTQETIILRLVMKNSGFVPYLPFSIFWALLGPKKGRGPTDTHIGLGPQTQPKSWPTSHLVDYFVHLLSWNWFFIFYDLGPPLNDRCAVT